jgi:hypothetical protein
VFAGLDCVFAGLEGLLTRDGIFSWLDELNFSLLLVGYLVLLRFN